MSRNQIIAIFASLLILVVGVAGYFVLRGNNNADGTPTSGTPIVNLPSSGAAPLGETPKAPAGSAVIPGTNGTAAGKKIQGKKLTTTAIAGAVVLPGLPTVVRYAERDTGHMYEVSMADGEVRETSHTTFPNISKAVWSPDGRIVVFQTVGNGTYENRAFVVPSATSSEIALQPIPFPKEADALAFSPDSSKLFYLTTSGIETTGTLLDLVKKKEAPLWHSPLHEWNLSWTDPKAITLATKPSADAEGVVLSVDAKTGGEKDLVFERPGLTALASPDGKHLFASESSGNIVSSLMYTTATGAASLFTPPTIAEKCTWTADSSLYCAAPALWPDRPVPEDWYKGLFHTNDTLWRFGPRGASFLFWNPSDEGVNELIDMTNILPTPTEEYLFFTNKTDSTLWVVSNPSNE